MSRAFVTVTYLYAGGVRSPSGRRRINKRTSVTTRIDANDELEVADHRALLFESRSQHSKILVSRVVHNHTQRSRFSSFMTIDETLRDVRGELQISV